VLPHVDIKGGDLAQLRQAPLRQHRDGKYREPLDNGKGAPACAVGDLVQASWHARVGPRHLRSATYESLAPLIGYGERDTGSVRH